MATPNRDVRSSSMGGGILAGPDKPTIVHCKELKVRLDHLLLQELIDGQVTSLKEVYLWVDINGCKIIEAMTRKVTWMAAYNEITAWAVEQDHFKIKMVGKKNKLKERTFLTGYSKAMELKSTLEEMVKLYLHEPDLVLSLQKVAAVVPVGTVLSWDVLSRVQPFGSGQFVDISLSPMASTGQVTASTLGTLGDAAQDSEDPWQARAEMTGFHCFMVEETPTGTVRTQVLLIVKGDGLHTIKADESFSGPGEGPKKKVIFFAHNDIVKTRLVPSLDAPDHMKFVVTLRLNDAEMKFSYLTKDGDRITEALTPYIPLRAAVLKEDSPTMFEELSAVELMLAGVDIGDVPEQRALAQRVKSLAGTFETCMSRIAKVSTEDELLQECMSFMEKLNAFVGEVTEGSA